MRYFVEPTLPNKMVIVRIKCAEKITRKYMVASLTSVWSRLGRPNCLHDRRARTSMMVNTSESSKGGISVTVRK